MDIPYRYPVDGEVYIKKNSLSAAVSPFQKSKDSVCFDLNSVLFPYLSLHRCHMILDNVAL